MSVFTSKVDGCTVRLCILNAAAHLKTLELRLLNFLMVGSSCRQKQKAWDLERQD